MVSVISVQSVQSFSHFWLFATPWTAARQASMSIPNSQSLLKLMSIKSVMPFNYLIPFPSCLQSLPVSESFPVSQFFALGGQNIDISASASILPMNIQDWFPLELTGLICLQFKGLSRIFSNTTIQKHQFFSAQLSLLAVQGTLKSLLQQFKSTNSLAPSFLYSPTLTSIHDYWKTHSFDYTDLYQQNNVSGF